MLKNLKYLRECDNISQRQLADKIGVSQQSINKYENHNIEPDIETLIRIADYFNTTVDNVIGHSTSTNLDSQGVPISAEESRIINSYRRLSDKQKQSIVLILENYIEES